jgi:hypothetical protein
MLKCRKKMRLACDVVLGYPLALRYTSGQESLIHDDAWVTETRKSETMENG